MNEEIIHRQQIERDYHNNKYRFNTASQAPSLVNTAYDFYQSIIDRFEIGRVLDFGCGDGWVSINLARQGHDVYGIDISIELVNKARKWAEESGLSQKAHFEEMAGENLVFQKNYFDAVVGSAVLHHTDFEMALNSIYRVLKPGGTGLFIEPMNQNILLKIWRVLSPWRRSPAEKALTRNELNMITKVFPAARLNYFIFTSMFTKGLMTIFPNIKFVNKLNIMMERFDDFLIGHFPGLGKSCAVVVIELIKGEEPI